MILKKLIEELKNLGNKRDKEILQKFFKTGPGQYGEGDIFLGIKVPVQRKVAAKYKGLKINDVQKLLDSKIHEERLVGLVIMIHQFEEGNEEIKKKVFEMYMNNSHRVNNWDLVDITAPRIAGAYLLNKDKKILYQFAKEKLLWRRRIAIVSTYKFIKNNQFEDVVKLSEILLNDKEDLMHKAVGWMLREAGKMNKQVLIDFLDKHCKNMPRTTLRYSIEKLSEKEKKYYMKK